MTIFRSYPDDQRDIGMCRLTVRLFGNFQVQRDDQDSDAWNARKVQELFAYLLLYRERRHLRQVLAELLWPESTSEQSKKYFRHTLWQLQISLGCKVLEVDAETLHLTGGASLWLDVSEFERACARVRGVPGEELDGQGAHVLDEALKLYRGDLLEGWYQDWCLFERDRLQRIYLAMLEKRMAYCEAYDEFEIGLDRGNCALRYDVAHERIHRRMMRLYHKSGDRTAALRQYKRCVTLLREELDVDPSERTVALYEQIRSGRLTTPVQSVGVADDREHSPTGTHLTLDQALSHLKRLETSVSEVEQQLQEAIKSIEATLNVKG
jgi:DNA-binding SARP family transcriptional activator